MGEAVRHAVYVLNRVTTKALKEKTPYEAWSGRKPNLEHLKVFGCIAHTKVVRVHLRKLENRSKPLVYLGTELGSKAYRLLDPDNGTICVSRDVCFEEDREWSWRNSVKFKDNLGVPFVVEGYGDDFISQEQYDGSFNGEGSSHLRNVTYEDISQQSPIQQAHDEEYSDSVDLAQESPHNSPLPLTEENPTTPNSSTSSNTTSSESTGGGAQKRYRRLSDIYRQEDELLLATDHEEPESYAQASKESNFRCLSRRAFHARGA